MSKPSINGNLIDTLQNFILRKKSFTRNENHFLSSFAQIWITFLSENGKKQADFKDTEIVPEIKQTNLEMKKCVRKMSGCVLLEND